MKKAYILNIVSDFKDAVLSQGFFKHRLRRSTAGDCELAYFLSAGRQAAAPRPAHPAAK